MDKRNVYLVGIGMGGNGTLTEEARRIVEKSEIIVGAKRMLESFSLEDKDVLVSYKADEIASYLREKHVFQNAAVLLSGDVGFYSGARKLIDALHNFSVELIPGISSMIYFCSRLQIPWEDVCACSVHGRNTNLIQRIQRYKRTFFLLDGEKGLKQLCEKLLYYGMNDVTLYIGENLSYEEERIVSGTPEEFKEYPSGSLLVGIVENPYARNWAARSISDEEFIRSKVPMTKSEVRTVSVGKLQLEADSVVYDVGGGSGSVSIEIALQAPDIKVYSIEKNPDALALMEANKKKFAADNMEIIDGSAPEALDQLPAPTHAFIGGSSGSLEAIIESIFQKNQNCRIVVNTIALNSLAQIIDILDAHPEYRQEIIQLQTSAAKKAGRYQLMMGQNPIYIISLWKEREVSE